MYLGTFGGFFESLLGVLVSGFGKILGGFGGFGG